MQRPRSDRVRDTVVHPLLIAGWCALAAGLLEALRHAVWRFGLDRLTWMSQDVFWLAPLSYVLLFAVPAIALTLVAWLSPRRVPPWLSMLLFTTAGAFGVLALLGRHQVSLWALGVLALGVGLQAARFAHHRPDAVLRTIRRTLPWMAAVVVLLMLWFPLGGSLRERLAERSLADAPEGAPSVLLIILDTVRARNLSVYGYDRPTTPNLERLASEGVVFDDAIAPAPWTLPSHASLFTGRWPHQLTADWAAPLDGTDLTLAESLRSRGYATGAFVANLLYTGRDAGLSRGFLRYRDMKLTRRQLLLSSFLGQTLDSWRTGWWPYYPLTHRKHAPEVSAQFLEWLSRHEARPFFAFLNYFDAHQPYRAPPAFRERFESGSPGEDRYDAAIAYIDSELGLLLGELEHRGRLDNTIVIVASDHGELFGEHGLTGHGNSLYRPVLRVPLLMWHPPGVPAGRRIAQHVSLRQLPATIAELTNGAAAFPGESLVAFWDAAGSTRPDGAVLAEVSRGVRRPPSEPVSRGPMKSLFVGRQHYIRNGDGQEELYDLLADPAERNDIAGTPAAAPELLRLRRLLDEVLGRSELADAAPGR